LADPCPLPALFDGVDRPLFPAFAADLLAEVLPPAADFVPPPEVLFADAFLLPADEVPLLVPAAELRFALDEEAVEAFLLPPDELLLPLELLLLLDEPADLELLLAAPLLLLADEAVDLLLPLLLFEPLVFPPPDADLLLLPDEPVLLLAVLLPELLPAEPDDAVRAEARFEPDPFLPPAVDLLFPDVIEDDPGPPVTLFIAESEAPTTAPVAAPATISPTRSFALS
jgi:hypothetical protein